MIFPQFVIYVLIDNYLKFRKDPSITSQEIANYISVALAVALSVYTEEQMRCLFGDNFKIFCQLSIKNLRFGCSLRITLKKICKTIPCRQI